MGGVQIDRADMEGIPELGKSVEMQIYQLESQYHKEKDFPPGENSAGIHGKLLWKGRNQMTVGPEHQGREFVSCSISHIKQKAHMLKDVFQKDWEQPPKGRIGLAG